MDNQGLDAQNLPNILRRISNIGKFIYIENISNCSSFRFVHRHDIITKIPPENMKCVQCNQGYKHHGIEIPL